MIATGEEDIGWGIDQMKGGQRGEERGERREKKKRTKGEGVVLSRGDCNMMTKA